MNTDRFEQLVGQLSGLTNSVVNETDMSSFDLRRLLRFLSKVVQVAEQAFQDVLATMIEFKYVTNKDRQSGRLDKLAKELELLQARSRYRDAEEICSRLHNLTDYYQHEIEPITRNLSNRNEWWQMLRLLNEHEGYIIELVGQSVGELQRLLKQPDIDVLNTTADRNAAKVKDSLSQLRSLNSRILGLSGTTGLLELTEEKRPDAKNRLNLTTGDVYNVGQAGAVGPNAQAHDMAFTQVGNQTAWTADLVKLSVELAQLRQAMKKESIIVEHDIAVSEIAKAEQAAMSKDSNAVAEHLKAAGKWALDIATQIGVPVAVEALKQASGIK